MNLIGRLRILISNNPAQWLLLYLSPLVIGALIEGSKIMIIPLGAFGVLVGLLAGAPYFTLPFKLAIGSSAAVATALFILGIKFRAHLWGKIVDVLGAYLWCATGVIGFGPH